MVEAFIFDYFPLEKDFREIGKTMMLAGTAFLPSRLTGIMTLSLSLNLCEVECIIPELYSNSSESLS